MTEEQITKEKLVNYLEINGLTKKMTVGEISQFVETATAFNLNPYKKEIFCNVYGEGDYRQCSILMGYGVFLKRAERTNKLNGWSCTTVKDENDLKAVLTIYRKDWQYPFVHEAYFSEVKQTKKNGELNQFWRKMGKFMLKKVCISQGFRLAFPDDLGGLPYTDAEIQPEQQPEQLPESQPEQEKKEEGHRTEGLHNSIKQLFGDNKTVLLQSERDDAWKEYRSIDRNDSGTLEAFLTRWAATIEIKKLAEAKKIDKKGEEIY